MADAPRVFLSYSHDSDEHADRVLALADALCDRGIDVILDRYVHPAPAEGWPRWMDRNLDEAKFVLMVCTETYRRRVMGLEEPGKGLGVRWEGSLIYNRIYHDKPSGSRFIPILLPGSEPAHIPNPVQGHAYYRIATFDLTDPGFEALYRHLTDQPATPRPDLGAAHHPAPEATTATVPEPSLLRKSDDQRPGCDEPSVERPRRPDPGRAPALDGHRAKPAGPALSGLPRLPRPARPRRHRRRDRRLPLAPAPDARDYGEVEPGMPALRALLESVKDEVGVSDRERIEEILRAHPR